MISYFSPESERSELPTVSLNCLALEAWLKYFLPTQRETFLSRNNSPVCGKFEELLSVKRVSQMLTCWPRCQSQIVLISTGELSQWSLHQRRKMISRLPWPDLPSLSTPASMKGESTWVVSRLSWVKMEVASNPEIFARNWAVWDI